MLSAAAGCANVPYGSVSKEEYRIENEECRNEK
jgi:hypothetical protein